MISIVVPIYNSERYLDKCIKYILHQTFINFELILVNDGSTDKSLSICRKYEKLDERIRVISKKNEGSIATRRRGIDEAKFDYITFIDADDWISSNTLELVWKEIERNSPDIIIFNIYNVFDNLGLLKKENSREYFERRELYLSDDIKRELVTAYFHGHPFPASLFAKVYKSKYLKSNGKYLKNIKFSGDDLFYNIEIFLKVNKVSMINKALYYYRKGGSTSRYMPYLINDMIEGYKIQTEIIKEYYYNTQHSNLNGPSVMLLNTFKTYLENIFLSDMSESDIKKDIYISINNNEFMEAIENKAVKKVFESEYLEAIKCKNVNYLYYKGKKFNIRSKYKQVIMKIFKY